MIKIEKGYYESGQLYYETPYDQNKRHGIEKVYYESGQLDCEISYDQDKLHGIVKGYYESGKINCINYYLYGKKVPKDKYRKHILIESLAGINNGKK